MLKLAVCVSGGGTNLQAIIDAIDSGRITNAQIEVVISNNAGAYALERAKNNGIKGVCISPKDFESREAFNEAFVKELDSYEVDLVVLAGFLVVIPPEMIKKYPNKIINIHPSLIPAFCGPGYYGIHVHDEAFKRGVKVAGATIHFVSNEVDGGPIILQEAIDVSDCDSAKAMQEKVLLNVEHKLLVKALKLYCENKVVVEDERVKIL